MIRKLFTSQRSPRSKDRKVVPETVDLTSVENVSTFGEIATTRLKGQSACPLSSGGILLLAPDDVTAAFFQKSLSNQPSRFSALAPRNSSRYVAAKVASNIPPFQDAPRHTLVRKWLSKSVLVTLKAQRSMIDEAARAYVDDLPSDQDMHLVEDVGRGFATQLICAFAGVKLSQDDLKSYTSALFRLFAPVHDAAAFERTNEALANARTALIAQIRDPKVTAGPNLVSSMKEWSHLLDELQLTADELDIMMADNVLLVLADGVENVEVAIGNVLLCWDAQPEERRVPVTEAFVRQCIKAKTPGQTIARIALDEFHIDGMTCPAGSPVFLSLAAANARSGDDADFSFGMGRHRCIGEGLAIEMIVSCCKHLTRRAPVLDRAGLRFEPVFGHRWTRGVTVSLADRDRVT